MGVVRNVARHNVMKDAWLASPWQVVRHFAPVPETGTTMAIIQ